MDNNGDSSPTSLAETRVGGWKEGYVLTKADEEVAKDICSLLREIEGIHYSFGVLEHDLYMRGRGFIG